MVAHHQHYMLLNVSELRGKAPMSQREQSHCLDLFLHGLGACAAGRLYHMPLTKSSLCPRRGERKREDRPPQHNIPAKVLYP